jgi:hypothetical protein
MALAMFDMLQNERPMTATEVVRRQTAAFNRLRRSHERIIAEAFRLEVHLLRAAAAA